jgi:cation diffusion facilitator CzcD-associated flavoprotein CzcO
MVHSLTPQCTRDLNAAINIKNRGTHGLKGLPIKKIPKNFLWCGHTMANATLRYRQAQYKSCPLIIKDGQDAHPTKLGNLFFGVP